MFFKIKNAYLKKYEIIFLVLFAVYYGGLILINTMYSLEPAFSSLLAYSRKLCYLSMMLLLAANLLSGLYNRRQIILFVIVGIILFIIAYQSKNFVHTLILWILLYDAKDVSLKKIIRVAFIVNVLILSLSVFGVLTGVIDDRLYYRGDMFVRHSLGFQYTTNIANYFMSTVLMFVYINHKKPLIFSFLVLILTYVIFATTDTKSAFIFSTIAIIFYIFYSLNLIPAFIEKITGLFSVIGAEAALIICLLLQYIYRIRRNGIGGKLNAILNGRLDLANSAIDNYGINLFGREVEWIGADNIYSEVKLAYNYVDSSFLQYILTFGIVYIVLVCLLYTYMGYKANKQKDIALSFVFLVIIGHSMFDPQMMWLDYTPFLLYFLAGTEKKNNINYGNNIG